MKRVTQDGPLGDKLMLRDPEAGVLAITGGTVFTSTGAAPITPGTS